MQNSCTLTSLPIVADHQNHQVGYKLVYRTIGPQTRYYTCPAGTDTYTEWHPGKESTVRLTERPLELCHNALHYSLNPLGTWQYFSLHPAAINVFREQRQLSMHHVEVPLGTEIVAPNTNVKMSRSDRLKRGAWRLRLGQPVTGAAFWPTDRNFDLQQHYITSGTVGCCMVNGLLHSLPLSVLISDIPEADQWMLPSHVDHSYGTLTYRWSIGGHNVLSAQRPIKSKNVSSGRALVNDYAEGWRRLETPELDWQILLFPKCHFEETERAFAFWQRSGTQADLPLALGLQMQFISAIMACKNPDCPNSSTSRFSQLMSELVFGDSSSSSPGMPSLGRNLQTTVFDNRPLVLSLFRKSIQPHGSLSFERSVRLFAHWLCTMDNSFTVKRLQTYFAPCLANDGEREIARQIVEEMMEDFSMPHGQFLANEPSTT